MSMPTGSIVRTALVVSALAVLGFAERLHSAAQESYAETFEFSWGKWTGWIVLLVLTGLLVGVAAAPNVKAAFTWRVPLIVGGLPLLLLLRFALIFMLNDTLTMDVYADTHVQSVLAVIVGLAIAAGFYPTRSPNGVDSIS